MANYNPNHKQVLDAMLLANPKVRAGKMFGFPAYYAGKKLAICLYEQGVGIKLPPHLLKSCCRRTQTRSRSSRWANLK